MTNQKTNKIDHAELMRLYSDGEAEDQSLYAEQRSNLLLYAGDHYNKKVSNFYRRIRDSKELSTEQKLRLTKNHVQYICDVYVNQIVSSNPGVGFLPKNEKELHDQKVAEIHHAVWRDAYEKYDINDLIDDWADSFIQIGEVATKIFFDKTKGELKGYEPDEFGNPDMEKPVYTGEFVFQEIYGFNIFRPIECKDIKKAEWIGIRSMVNKKELAAKYPDLADKITSSQDETYHIFDAEKSGYGKSDNQTLLLEVYYRPSIIYPKGQYFLFTKDSILDSGELPGGVFPIVIQPCTKLPTSCRGKSIIKVMRPYQAEINRAASKIAEHQITLGDDKLLIQNGTKVSSGAGLPGVRTVNYSGMEPKVLSGRDGSQYLGYMQSQQAEMYQVMKVKELIEDKQAQLDPYMALYQSARNKKLFQRFIKRFEKFLINVVKTYQKLAKIHLTDDYMIYAIGSNELVNVSEFRQLDDICYEIKVEAQAEDVEEKLGKTLAINHVLQYVGNQLKPDDIGKMIRQMPYANLDKSFDDLTIDYDSAMNDLLALDRGEMPPINQYDNHVYNIKVLTKRMRDPSFKLLPPYIQNNYAMKVKTHQEFESANQLAIQRAQQGFIPTGGYMVKADLYTADPSNPNKVQRVTLPSESLQWLMKQISSQREGFAPIMDMNEGAQAQIADMTANGQQQPVGVDNGLSMPI